MRVGSIVVSLPYSRPRRSTHVSTSCQTKRFNQQLAGQSGVVFLARENVDGNFVALGNVCTEMCDSAIIQSR
jgi:hypothetical protein